MAYSNYSIISSLYNLSYSNLKFYINFSSNFHEFCTAVSLNISCCYSKLIVLCVYVCMFMKAFSLMKNLYKNLNLHNVCLCVIILLCNKIMSTYVCMQNYIYVHLFITVPDQVKNTKLSCEAIDLLNQCTVIWNVSIMYVCVCMCVYVCMCVLCDCHLNLIVASLSKPHTSQSMAQASLSQKFT